MHSWLLENLHFVFGSFFPFSSSLFFSSLLSKGKPVVCISEIAACATFLGDEKGCVSSFPSAWILSHFLLLEFSIIGISYYWNYWSLSFRIKALLYCHFWVKMLVSVNITLLSFLKPACIPVSYKSWFVCVTEGKEILDLRGVGVEPTGPW